MNIYMVSATMTVPAWIQVEADNEAEAMRSAREQRPADFSMDIGGAEVEFNVNPAVAELPF